MTRRADARDFDPVAIFGQSDCDRVYFSYTLSMIPDWQTALSHAIGLLAPGGELHIVDFGQSEGLRRWFRKALFVWLACFGVHPRAGLAACLAEKAEGAGFVAQITPLYKGYAWHAVLRRA